ncbi:unnamed protein product [Pleuronectes platessa]|uniref:Uncharacterized protein n=1 Tax=Pleuronectes platessa TaxID=8262 RepID=A0A9N7UW13_PLEPL|nr:unnamed protein product [Pleuronectes platessa]
MALDERANASRAPTARLARELTLAGEPVTQQCGRMLLLRQLKLPLLPTARLHWGTGALAARLSAQLTAAAAGCEHVAAWHQDTSAGMKPLLLRPPRAPPVFSVATLASSLAHYLKPGKDPVIFSIRSLCLTGCLHWWWSGGMGENRAGWEEAKEGGMVES